MAAQSNVILLYELDGAYPDEVRFWQGFRFGYHEAKQLSILWADRCKLKNVNVLALDRSEGGICTPGESKQIRFDPGLGYPVPSGGYLSFPTRILINNAIQYPRGCPYISASCNREEWDAAELIVIRDSLAEVLAECAWETNPVAEVHAYTMTTASTQRQG